MQALADSDLVTRSRGGQVDAFAQLVDRYQGLVCAIAFAATGDRALSEDVAQETFVAAWRGLDGIREPDKMRAWLCQTARNLGRKALRRRGREVPRDDVDQALESTEPPPPTPLDEIMERESEELVWQTLQRIPETYREPLVLFYRQGKSAREVGDALGIAEDAVHQRLSRGRKYLERSVGELVERTLERTKPSRSLAVGVVAAIAAGTAGAAEAGAAATSTAGAGTAKTAIAAGGAWTMKAKIAVGAALAVLFVAGGAALVRSQSSGTDAQPEAAADTAPGARPAGDGREPVALPAATPPEPNEADAPPAGAGDDPEERATDGDERQYLRFEVDGDDGALWYKLFSGFPACTEEISFPEGEHADHVFRVRLRLEPAARGRGTRLRAATVIDAPEGAAGLRAFERCLVSAHAGVAFPEGRREALLTVTFPHRAQDADDEPEPEIDRDLLEALPVEVGFARGRDDAAVTIVVYTDFQCPYCTRALATMDELLDEYPEDLRVVTKLFPLKPSSRRLAEATVAAAEQGKFWPMHDLIFAYQDAAGLTDDDLRDFAEQIGLNVRAFMRALDSEDVAALVQADIDEGSALGVRGTPTMLVDGERVVGAQPIDVFRKLIDAHLAAGGNQ